MESNVAQLPMAHKALAWFEQNRKQVTWVALVVTVVGLGIWFVVWQRAQMESRASRALSDVILAQAGFGGGPVQETAQPYLKVAEEFPNSVAAARAVLLAAGALFNQSMYGEAEAQFQRFTRDYRESPFLGQGLLGIAACLDAQGKADQAVNAYKDLISRHPSDSVIPQAKFALGRIYEAQNKPELARDLYEQVERDNRMSALGSEAGMRVEELIQKYPHLAPPPPPAPAPFNLTPMPATGALDLAVGTNAPPAAAVTNAPAGPPQK